MSTAGRALFMAAGMAGSGALHLVHPTTYDWMIPPELGPARPWVTGSGVAELAGLAHREAGTVEEIRAAATSPALVEVRTDRSASVREHRLLVERATPRQG
jgi:uncharacterized membrane protein